MSAPKSAVAKAVAEATAELRQEAVALDLRRQKQIANQVASITRLVEDPSAAKEIERLNRELAEAQARIEELS